MVKNWDLSLYLYVVKELAKFFAILSIIILYCMAVNAAKSTASLTLSIESNAGHNFYSSSGNANLLFHTAQTDVLSIASSSYVLPTLKKVVDKFNSTLKVVSQLESLHLSECNSPLLTLSVQLKKFLIIFPFHSFW